MSINPIPAGTPRRLLALTRRQSILLVTGVVVLGGLGVIWGGQTTGQAEIPNKPHKSQDDPVPNSPLRVAAVRPSKGGLARQVVQTGSVEPYESAELFARVSGNLQSINVEIGDRVRKDQVLAVLDAPELVKDKERQAALVKQFQSRVTQAQARLATARAERQGALGALNQADAQVSRAAAECSFRTKELDRIKKLAEKNAVEAKLVDEKLHRFEAAKAATAEAQAQAEIAAAELAAIDSKIKQAQADVAAAEADVLVAEADLAKAQVMLGFTQITAPFDGVVTRRNFDRGTFIRAATDGASEPLLEIARTDRMRVVVRIPAPDVPYLQPGQQANVRIDALGGGTFQGTIARVARQQDSRTRTMRAEIDLANPDNKLVGGMYAAVTIEIPAPAENLTLPEECLAGPAFHGRGKVYLLVGGCLHAREVNLGQRGNGRVEVLANLSEAERVVASIPPGLEEDLDGRAAVAP